MGFGADERATEESMKRLTIDVPVEAGRGPLAPSAAEDTSVLRDLLERVPKTSGQFRLPL
jgi:hypothetical protein